MLEFLFNKVKVIKKAIQHRCFPMNFAKLLRTLFFDRAPSVTASTLCE